jgi:hypothetical protein
LSQRTVPLEGIDGSAGSRACQIGIDQHKTQRDVPRPTRHKGQAADDTPIQRVAYQVLWQPRVSEASLNDS